MLYQGPPVIQSGLLLLLFWSPVREVCPNKKLVVFQPRTLTNTHLGSCRLSLKYNLVLVTNLSPLLCLDLRFSLFPTAPPSVDVPHQISLVSPATHLLSHCYAAATWASTSTHQPPPLVPVPCAACLRLTPFPCRFTPTFADLGLHPGPCLPLGGLLSAGPSVPLCL